NSRDNVGPSNTWGYCIYRVH
ncbi:hypothetical protein S40285_09766, partial [Stachybotrys chlorohalonatus IBT 40285]